jgi:hypothetical protein
MATLRPTDRLVVPALAETLAALNLGEVDKAAVRLAQRYARELDDAALISAKLTKALRELAAVDVDLHDRFLTLAVRIEESAVAASIGPKLLAVLESLGATPAARSRLEKGGVPDAGTSRLAALREARGG